MDMMQLAMQMIRNNPQVQNNPRNKEMIDVIMSGDSKRGIELANNLCNTYGTSREDAINMAKQRFGIR